MINRKGKGATMRPCPSLVTLSVSLLMLLLLSAGAAAGKTLYVKTSGNNSASCTATAPCQSISHAVAVAASGDTISVGTGTFVESGSIGINKDLTIAGGWWLATRVSLFIDPKQKAVPVFLIGPGAKVKLAGLTASGGNGSGIHNNGGDLTLTNVWITNNTGNGGIINTKAGLLFMTNVGIANNSGQAGLINHGTAYVVDSLIERTDHDGGLGDGVDNSGTLIMIRGLIAGNDGAGLAQWDPHSVLECTATTHLLNVTISGNHTRGIDAQCGQLILQHVTIAANTADIGAGGLQVHHTVPVIENSIIATNSGKQCGFVVEPPGSGTVNSTSVAYSLVGDNSCLAWPPGPQGGNLIGVDPKLSALAYPVGEDLLSKLLHIGANRVHALLPGSPAIDRGADKYCTGFIYGGPTDQLGVQRPVDGDGDGKARCDMGAYEYQPPK
jgi:hypothetical protein